MQDHIKTLELMIKQKQEELGLITTGGWQIYRRHEKGGEPPGNLEHITIAKGNELRAEIRELTKVADAIRPKPPV
jgi:hypothetical protein